MPISEMTKLRLKEVKEVAQVHTASKEQRCVPQTLWGVHVASSSQGLSHLTPTQRPVFNTPPVLDTFSIHLG